ncbi:MAG: translation initiation factor IF-2 N-terminal domain-containing protein [Myxococcota bacterium]
MVKKRVHELAKEYGLENKDAIKLLQQAGISVKTHSSSIHEDEARAILQKTSKPEKPAPKKRPGMMIVRKRAEVEESTPEIEEESAPVVEALATQDSPPSPTQNEETTPEEAVAENASDTAEPLQTADVSPPEETAAAPAAPVAPPSRAKTRELPAPQELCA